jgi:membrane associated rhomboid family serine protease
LILQVEAASEKNQLGDIACILVSLVFWFSNPDVIVEYLAFSGDNLLNGRVWTLVTSLFLHGDILHLAGNMLFLYIFGNTIEEEMGATKTLGAFFIGGIITFPLSLLFYDWATPLIGASAAIFTIAAIVMLIKPLKLSIFLFLPQGWWRFCTSCITRWQCIQVLKETLLTSPI